MSQGGTAVPIARRGDPNFQSFESEEGSARGEVAQEATTDRSAVRCQSAHNGAKEYSSATASDLLKGARQEDLAAWEELVHRYAPLVMGIARTYRLTSDDAVDVCQAVWLQLLLHGATIKEPEALPGWIATTARRACLRLATSVSRTVPVSPIDATMQNLQAVDAEVDAQILRAVVMEAVRDGLAELSPTQRNLLVLLASSPPLSYRDISERLGMPVGSIGPTRARALARLRTTRALQPFVRSSPSFEQASCQHSADADVASRGSRPHGRIHCRHRVV